MVEVDGPTVKRQRLRRGLGHEVSGRLARGADRAGAGTSAGAWQQEWNGSHRLLPGCPPAVGAPRITVNTH